MPAWAWSRHAMPACACPWDGQRSVPCGMVSTVCLAGWSGWSAQCALRDGRDGQHSVPCGAPSCAPSLGAAQACACAGPYMLSRHPWLRVLAGAEQRAVASGPPPLRAAVCRWDGANQTTGCRWVSLGWYQPRWDGAAGGCCWDEANQTTGCRWVSLGWGQPRWDGAAGGCCWDGANQTTGCRWVLLGWGQPRWDGAAGGCRWDGAASGSGGIAQCLGPR